MSEWQPQEPNIAEIQSASLKKILFIRRFRRLTQIKSGKKHIGT
jgi:hypothetical protein